MMKFEQAACLGYCPTYSIEIHGDGSATYKGDEYVAVHGEHHHRLKAAEVNLVLQAFDDVGFETLDESYPPTATDEPYEVYTLERNGKKKTVNDGRAMEILRPLLKAFDRYAGAEQWARGNWETVPVLKRERFDFHSQEAGAILTRVAILGDPEAVLGLLQRGVPLNIASEFPKHAICWRRYEATASMLKNAGAHAGSCYL